MTPEPWSLGAGATISGDGIYRYRLWRVRHGLNFPCRTVVFVMLNPSTADASTNDATVRTCIGYAEAWGYDRVDIVNLYAFRTPSPVALKEAGYPRGPDNDRHIAEATENAELIVIAWGANAEPAYADEVRARLVATKKRVVALKFNKDGSPVHPLYQSRDIVPISITN